jgi:hypothetical protein
MHTRRLLLTLSLLAAMLFGALPTRAVRAAQATSLVLVSTLDGPPLAASLRILERYDAFVLAEVPIEDLPALQQQYDVDPLPDRTVLSLNGTVFDTTQGEPSIPVELRSPADDPYFLIQFYGPPKDEWKEPLEKMGVAFLGYHPSFTYIVRMDPKLLPEVQVAHAVQWVGRYHPAYRLAPEADMKKALQREGQVAVDVRSFPGENLDALQQVAEGAGLTIEFVSPGETVQARVWAAPETLPRLAALPGVYRVVPYDPPQLQNERAAQVMHTWDVRKASRNGLLQDLMGAGQIAGMVDTGLDNNTTSPTVEDFYDYTGGTASSRVAASQAGSGCGTYYCTCQSTDDADEGGHGTHVAGSIVGNGYNALAQRGLTGQARGADPSFDYAWGVGQAPEARIAVAHVSGRYYGYPSLCGIGNSYTTWQNLYNAGARTVNNSWGNATTSYGGYDDVNADAIMWNYQDYLVLASASNAGPGWNTVAQPGTAKNIVSVGATTNHRSVWGLTSDSAGVLTYFSGRGPVNPTADNRAKPDVVAPGADVLSTRTNFISATEVGLWGNEPGDGDGDGKPDYAWSGGTSMSGPLVTGAATVIRDYFQDIQGLGASTPPSAALIKAALLNGAVDMGYGYESFTAAPYGGRNMQGWGMVNVEQSITPRAPRSFFFDDRTDITGSRHTSNVGFTASGQFQEYTVDVVDSGEPLKVTLTWTDRQDGGDGFAVNNLDLLVTAPAPDGSQYRGNVFSGSWSVTGGLADSRNNTEAVYLQDPISGTWTIRVTDAGHGGGTQPYALFVSGGLGPDPSYTTPGDMAGRHGDSAQPSFPSLKPLSGSDEYTPPGASFITSFRLTNWGTFTDTISLSSSVTDMSGNAVSGIAVSFNPAGPFTLAAGAPQDVQATVSVDSGVASGPYDVTITASSGGSSRKDAMVIGLNVIPGANLSNEKRVVQDPGPQYAPDLWGTGQTLWAAYLSAESHNDKEAEIWTACSTDGGQTWTKIGPVGANEGAYAYGPAIAGNSTGSSITVVWTRPNSATYSRTWNQTSGCSGTWKSIRTLWTPSTIGTWRVAEPDVIYDNDGTILAVWRAYDYDNALTEGVLYSQSTNDGTSWSAYAGVPNASCYDCLHLQPQLTLDTKRNDVWLAYAHAYTLDSADRDIRLKRWSGTSNTWQSGNPVVAGTPDRETRPGIAYIADTDALWVTWHRYADFANATARLYYARSNSDTLPNPTFGTTYGPYATRTAEMHPAMIVGDSTFTYMAYLAYNDSFRGGNVYLLKAPAGGGTPLEVKQLCATVDDPPLYARGNAGTPRLLWLQTTVNGQSFTGPTLLYSKNPPNSGDPDYSSNLGVAQTLFSLGEDFDLYLLQTGKLPTGVEMASFRARTAENGVLLTWQTVSEPNIDGFNLYRSDAPGGLYAQINSSLIPTSTNPSGADYEWPDTDVVSRTLYYYKLEVTHLQGEGMFYGPVWAMAGPVPTIYLPLVTRQW